MTENFEGFDKKVIDFLWELRLNNNKEWFDRNRDEYVRLLKNPFDSLSYELGERMGDLFGEKTEYHISRINRDIRFSKNKEPYKERRWVVFKHGIKGRWQDKPVYYFELTPEGYNFGMGAFCYDRSYAERMRKMIDANDAKFQKIIKLYKKQDMFILCGDDYKKKFSKRENKDELEWYQKKNIALCSRNYNDDRLYSRELIDFIMEGFKILVPFNEFLLKAVSE